MEASHLFPRAKEIFRLDLSLVQRKKLWGKQTFSITTTTSSQMKTVCHFWRVNPIGRRKEGNVGAWTNYTTVAWAWGNRNTTRLQRRSSRRDDVSSSHLATCCLFWHTETRLTHSNVLELVLTTDQVSKQIIHWPLKRGNQQCKNRDSFTALYALMAHFQL